MQERLAEFEARGVDVLVVSFGKPEQVGYFHRALGLRFPAAADPELRAYRAYGLERASAWKVWSPKVMWRYATLLWRGRKLQKADPEQDTHQLGGDFVIGADGRLLLEYRSSDPADRPSVATLLAALDRGDAPPA